MPKNNITSFFAKAAKLTTAATNSAVTADPMPLRASPLPTSPTPLVEPSSTACTPRAQPDALRSSISDSDEHLLLQDLRRTISTLPSTVPLGVTSDTLAMFSHTPTVSFHGGQDPWEDVVNPALDQVFGFGATQEEIRGIIRRGEKGMDGVYKYIKASIEDLKIDIGLFEGKIKRIIAAMLDL